MTTPQMSCPSGGSFYACGAGSRFVGCCQSNPCTNGCPAGNLQPASFAVSQYGLIPDEDCSANTAAFYTCTATTIPFWGCCKSNACNTSAGCPSGDLSGSVLFSNAAQAEPYLAAYNASFSTGTIAQSSLSSSATTSATSSPAVQSSTSTFSTSTTTGSPSAAVSAAAQTSAGLPVPQQSIAGPVAGGVVGGLAVIAALIFGIFWLKRRKTKADSPATTHDEQWHTPAQSVAFMTPELGETKDPKAFGGSSYTSSPHMTNSPELPAYFAPMPPRNANPHYELPGDGITRELDSGQAYHPYRNEMSKTPAMNST